MTPFQTAVQDLVVAARGPDPDPVIEAAGKLLQQCEQVTADDASWALAQLGPPLLRDEVAVYAPVVWVSEVLLGSGGDAWLILGPMIERLRDTLERAGRLVQGCRERMRQAGEPATSVAGLPDESAAAGESDPDALRRFGREAVEVDPRLATAWAALGPVCQVCAPIVDHFREARRLLRTRPDALLFLPELEPLAQGVGELVRVMDRHADEPPGGPIDEEVDRALADLARTTAEPPELGDETQGPVQALMRALVCADRATRDRALARLGELIAAGYVSHLGVLANVAGSLVEAGGDPDAALAAMLDRLPEVLSGATTFVDACADAAASAGRDLEAEEVDEDTLVEEYGADVAGDLPEAEGAWQSAPGLCLGVIGMLSRSPAGRARARADAALLEAAGDVGRLVGPAAFLVKMLQVLDDEELVVLDPGGKRGWRTVFSGVADNFQLHTLLAAALVGPADEGLLPGPVGSSLDETEAVPGRRLDPRIAGIARDLPCPPHNQPTVSSHLNLWTWRGLQADGTLPVNALGASDHWVWNEGVPADIPPFEGKRVVLLGTAPFSRSWNAGRVFDGMTADFRVVETLTPEASAAWLGRIAAAAGGG